MSYGTHAMTYFASLGLFKCQRHRMRGNKITTTVICLSFTKISMNFVSELAASFSQFSLILQSILLPCMTARLEKKGTHVEHFS